MSNESAIHQRNLEANILFVQQQHATTLKALHAEIGKLQKKCSDLTFQLTMQIPDLDREEKENEERRMKEEIAKSVKQRDELVEALCKKDKHLKLLQQKFKAHEHQYLEELKVKNVALNKLHEDLNSKSNDVAYLTTELHKLKNKQRKGSGNSQSSSEGGTAIHFEPVPPKQGMPKVRNLRRVDSSDKNARVIRTHSIDKPALLRSGVVYSTDANHTSSILDPAPFLHRESVNVDRSLDIHLKDPHPLLPPIAGREILEDLVTPDCDIVFHSSRGPQSNLTRMASSGQKSPEIETLALEQLSVVGLPWQSTAHGSNNTEYH